MHCMHFPGTFAFHVICTDNDVAWRRSVHRKSLFGKSDFRVREVARRERSMEQRHVTRKRAAVWPVFAFVAWFPTPDELADARVTLASSAWIHQRFGCVAKWVCLNSACSKSAACECQILACDDRFEVPDQSRCSRHQGFVRGRIQRRWDWSCSGQPLHPRRLMQWPVAMVPKTMCQCAQVCPLCRMRRAAKHDQSHRGWILPRTQVSGVSSQTFQACEPTWVTSTVGVGLTEPKMFLTVTAPCPFSDQDWVVVTRLRLCCWRRDAPVFKSSAFSLEIVNLSHLPFFQEFLESCPSAGKLKWRLEGVLIFMKVVSGSYQAFWLANCKDRPKFRHEKELRMTRTLLWKCTRHVALH